MPLAILWQHVTDIESGELQNIAQILFVFIAIQPTKWSSTLGQNFLVIDMTNLRRKKIEKVRLFRWQKGLILRWHFSLLNSIVNVYPAIAYPTIAEFKGQQRKIESAFGCFRIVALEARLLYQ